MITWSNFSGILDALSRISASETSGDLLVKNRILIIRLNGHDETWIGVYNAGSRDAIIDFAYQNAQPPEALLSELLDLFPNCALVDWSPGRLATVEVSDSNASQLAELIHRIGEHVFALKIAGVEAKVDQIHPA